MKKGIKRTAAVSLLLFLLFFLLNRAHPGGLFLPLAITFGTISYHFAIRLGVGGIFDLCMGNRADLTRPWYQPRSWEPRLYAWLRVKRWKARMPAYEPALFDPAKHSWSEIAQAMCQAELVHVCIALLSLLPMAGIPWFGLPWVFILTSVAAALLDLSFALLQRYNRPRVVRLMEKTAHRM